MSNVLAVGDTVRVLRKSENELKHNPAIKAIGYDCCMLTFADQIFTVSTVSIVEGFVCYTLKTPNIMTTNSVFWPHCCLVKIFSAATTVAKESPAKPAVPNYAPANSIVPPYSAAIRALEETGRITFQQGHYVDETLMINVSIAATSTGLSKMECLLGALKKIQSEITRVISIATTPTLPMTLDATKDANGDAHSIEK